MSFSPSDCSNSIPKNFREIREEKDKEMLQTDLDNLQSWSDTWLLKFHPKSIFPPLSRIVVHSSITFRNCRVVDLPEMKPNCLLLKSLLVDMCFTIVSQQYQSL
jgi:hypothetical protein